MVKPVDRSLLLLGDHFRPSSEFVVEKPSGVCAACGGFGPYRYAEIVGDELASQWKLTKAEQHAFSARESMFCLFCGCSYRLRALARALVLEVLPPKQEVVSLRAAIQKGYFAKVKVAEINSCGVLHDILKDLPELAYSEYGSTDPAVPHEDLAALSYADHSFDIVINSDTLEHVPDPTQALSEIKRILRPDGAHIFTVPMRLNAETVTRVKNNADKLPIHTRPASYHGSGEPDYLVWNEYGSNFADDIKKLFPGLRLFFINPLNNADPSLVVVARVPQHSSATRLMEPDYGSAADVRQAQKTLSSYDLTVQESPTEKLAMDQQLERLEYLSRKLQLTIDHTKNLEAIIDGQKQQFEQLEAVIREFEQSLPHRLKVRLSAIKARLTK